jgi:glycerate kinase
MKVLVIPDKFKGTLTAGAAVRAIARGWRRARCGDTLTSLPMGDGGDGFGEVVGRLLGARTRRIRTVDGAHRPCASRWWWEPGSRTAVVESAKVIGLAMLPGFHPFALDTFGLGAVLRAAARAGAKRCVVGIGGSATNDGGFGLARALGWTFMDRNGSELKSWTELTSLHRVRAPQKRRWFADLVVAVDVRNPLLGVRGATRVYGPQKGLRPGDFAHAEACLRRLSRVTKDHLGQELARVPGAGAAGGLGFGLLAFAGAQLEAGFDLFAQEAGLEQRLQQADLVITGEGSIDASTFMGKGVGEIAARCRKLGIPCIGLGGTVRLAEPARRMFTQVRALANFAGLKRAMKQPELFLERMAAEVATGVES